MEDILLSITMLMLCIETLCFVKVAYHCWRIQRNIYDLGADLVDKFDELNNYIYYLSKNKDD